MIVFFLFDGTGPVRGAHTLMVLSQIYPHETPIGSAVEGEEDCVGGCDNRGFFV